MKERKRKRTKIHTITNEKGGITTNCTEIQSKEDIMKKIHAKKLPTYTYKQPKLKQEEIEK